VLRPWLTARGELPVGPLFCVIDGRTQGRAWSAAAVRTELRRLAAKAGVRRRFAPHQLRHAHALELAREGVPLNIIQRQLGHANLGTTSIYLQGIDPEEIITAVRADDVRQRRAEALTPSDHTHHERERRTNAPAPSCKPSVTPPGKRTSRALKIVPSRCVGCSCGDARSLARSRSGG
jgi:DNA-binding transcriptional MerR regulator